MTDCCQRYRTSRPQLAQHIETPTVSPVFSCLNVQTCERVHSACNARHSLIVEALQTSWSVLIIKVEIKKSNILIRHPFSCIYSTSAYVCSARVSYFVGACACLCVCVWCMWLCVFVCVGVVCVCLCGCVFVWLFVCQWCVCVCVGGCVGVCVSV